MNLSDITFLIGISMCGLWAAYCLFMAVYYAHAGLAKAALRRNERMFLTRWYNKPAPLRHLTAKEIAKHRQEMYDRRRFGV